MAAGQGSRLAMMVWTWFMVKSVVVFSLASYVPQRISARFMGIVKASFYTANTFKLDQIHSDCTADLGILYEKLPFLQGTHWNAFQDIHIIVIINI